MSQTTMDGRRPAPPPRRRAPWRTIVGIAVVILVAVALALGLRQCASGGAAKGGPGGPGGRGGPGGGRPSITVGVAKATLGDIPITLNALGTVTPAATVNVTPRVSGMLVQVNFKEGQMVRKGQQLALVDPRPFQVALDQARGQQLRDQALLDNARIDLKRYQTLKAQDSIAGQQVDTQASLVRQYEAAVVSDKGAVGAAQLNLSFARITAPVSGRVGLRQVDAGNQIVANSATPITVVAQVDPIDVVFSVPEDQIPAITQAAGPSGSGLTVTTYDRTGGTALAQGTLSTIDNVVDVNTGTVKAKARFANTNGALFPNQFVNITLLITTLHNQVTVPATAVRHGSQGDFVWVLTDHTVHQRPVKVGPGTGEAFSIASGLNAGETVITDGGDRLRDGGTVTLPGETPKFGGAGGRGGHRRGQGGGQWNGGQGGGVQGGGGQAVPAGNGAGETQGPGSQGASPAVAPAFQPPAPAGQGQGQPPAGGRHHGQGGQSGQAPAASAAPGGPPAAQAGGDDWVARFRARRPDYKGPMPPANLTPEQRREWFRSHFGGGQGGGGGQAAPGGQ
ncbi:MdtA/MuxA family multidrug efflux RND transporter periplasmic adaptor subunit [Caulobacter sp. KR2-114]|uniref:MdtA/MuxA family multidrug efflux RND transporter periplasmic adaptor subunit n=1 Tax=Caulobacter sp. KR2-114 TaxID=3400912 RepID=UPI003BFB22C7